MNSVGDIVKPNFFIVGAAKCGTTSLYKYLAQHPQVFMPEIKEPYTLCPDLSIHHRWDLESVDKYLQLFEPAKGFKAVGEASVWYLLSAESPKLIKQMCEQAKIIIMLRQPADFLYSLHGQYLWVQNEDILDLAEALDAQPDRKQGRRMPKSCHFPEGLQYEWVADFPTQVARYYDVFGRDNTKVILFDDFVSDTRAVYEDVLRFLGLSPDSEADLRKHNAASDHTLRNLGIRRFLKKHHRFNHLLYKCLPKPVRGAIGSTIHKATGSVSYEQKPFDLQLRAELTKKLTPQIQELSRLIGRDLSAWL